MNKKEFFLKLSSAIAGSCLIVPVVSLFAWFIKISAVSIVPKFYAAYICCTIIGFFTAILFDKMALKFKKSRIKFNSAAIIVTPLWCFSAAYLLYNNNFLLRSLLSASIGITNTSLLSLPVFLTGVIYMGASIYGIKMFIRSQDSLLNQPNYLAVTIANIGSIVVVGFLKWQAQFSDSIELIERRFDISCMVPVFLMYIIIYMFVNNQTNISFVMDRRKSSHTSLPKSIRQFNFLLTAGICGTVFILYLFKENISQLIYSALNLLKIIGLGILWLIIFISDLLTFRSNNDPGIEQPIGQAIMAAAKSKDTPILNVIIFIVFILFVIIMVKLYWKAIYKLLLKVAAFFKKIWHSLLNNDVNVEVTEKSDYYYDSVEQLEPTLSEVFAVQKHENADNKLKRAIKEYKKQKNPEQLVINGFKILKAYFKLNGVKIDESDTAREIDKKVMGSTFKLKINDVSREYEKIKYNGEEPTEQTAQQVYNKVTDIVK